MRRLRWVTAEYALKLSTGNYGSEEVRFAASEELEDGEDAELAAAELEQWVRDRVDARLLLSRFAEVRNAVQDAPDQEPPDDAPF